MRDIQQRLLAERTLSPRLLPPISSFWLRAQDVPASPVALWPDVSGNGNDFVQATGARQPTVSPNVINGYPSVVFDGADDSVGSTININQPFTWVALCRITGTTSDRTVIGSQNPANASQLGAIARVLSGNVSMRAGSNFNGASVGAAFRVMGGVYNSALSILVDNTVYTSGNPGTGGANLITIGAYVQSGNPTFALWQGDVVEALGWSRALTTDELDDVYAYLATKYAL